MSDRDPEAILYVVDECPVLCGLRGVVALASESNGQIFFYSPCCGIAWMDLPHGSVDAMAELNAVAPQGARLPSLAELRAAGLGEHVLRTVALAEWRRDLEDVLP